MAAAHYRYTIDRTFLEDGIDRDERVLLHIQRYAQRRLGKIAQLSQEHLPVEQVYKNTYLW